MGSSTAEQGRTEAAPGGEPPCPTDGVALWVLREFVEEHRARLEKGAEYLLFRQGSPHLIVDCT